MSAIVKDRAPVAQVQAPPGLRVAYNLTLVIFMLTAIAAAGGLLWQGLYRGETAWTVPQMRGQDLVTLLALPFLLLTARAALRGSARGALAWIGLLGYLFYTYTGAAFAYRFNEFVLIYIALFSLTISALVAVVASLDVAGIARMFDAGTPRRAVTGFLVFLGVMLTLLWVGQMIPFFLNGTLPELVVKANTPTNFVYVLDLGFVVPLAAVGGAWLWRRAPWGYVAAGYVLIKGITMGLALLSMTLFTWLAGQQFDPFLGGVWVFITVSSATFATWLFRHCRG
ncbi:MAG: hypothetical protein K0R39_5108 [Symbiobacteriaceae bacterium]|jgi:hypothetical protein|nr:hypothetical protein [Symbiobacteriaceae bacterium]